MMATKLVIKLQGQQEKGKHLIIEASSEKLLIKNPLEWKHQRTEYDLKGSFRKKFILRFALYISTLMNNINFKQKAFSYIYFTLFTII